MRIDVLTHARAMFMPLGLPVGRRVSCIAVPGIAIAHAHAHALCCAVPVSPTAGTSPGPSLAPSTRRHLHPWFLGPATQTHRVEGCRCLAMALAVSCRARKRNAQWCRASAVAQCPLQTPNMFWDSCVMQIEPRFVLRASTRRGSRGPPPASQDGHDKSGDGMGRVGRRMQHTAREVSAGPALDTLW
jgi:hypothetical protein